jgi:hypothetical protein
MRHLQPGRWRRRQMNEEQKEKKETIDRVLSADGQSS